MNISFAQSNPVLWQTFNIAQTHSKCYQSLYRVSTTMATPKTYISNAVMTAYTSSMRDPNVNWTNIVRYLEVISELVFVKQHTNTCSDKHWTALSEGQ